MPLISRLEQITVWVLETAAEHRLDEAAHLMSGGFVTASIYLGGYAAEMLVGAALLKAIGFAIADPIPDQTYKQLIQRARRKSNALDPSHPGDGLARLLVEEYRGSSHRCYTREFERRMIDQTTRLCENWSPWLRYSVLDAKAEEFADAHTAIDWIVKHYPEM